MLNSENLDTFIVDLANFTVSFFTEIHLVSNCSKHLLVNRSQSYSVKPNIHILNTGNCLPIDEIVRVMQFIDGLISKAYVLCVIGVRK